MGRSPTKTNTGTFRRPEVAALNSGPMGSTEAPLLRRTGLWPCAPAASDTATDAQGFGMLLNVSHRVVDSDRPAGTGALAPQPGRDGGGDHPHAYETWSTVTACALSLGSCDHLQGGSGADLGERPVCGACGFDRFHRGSPLDLVRLWCGAWTAAVPTDRNRSGPACAESPHGGAAF
ncbi:hypothetical protein GCM10023080_090420 [Streptomyces pseudoechinosporeus]